MRLNTLQPKEGSKKVKVRVGRGIGSGMGKTCGKGHKGQKARAGGYHKVGFIGGQMPIQRRVPKFGFTSMTAKYVAEVRLTDLNNMKAEVIDMASLLAENVISNFMEDAKIFLSGTISRPITINGLRVTKGAREAILAAGGTIK